MDHISSHLQTRRFSENQQTSDSIRQFIVNVSAEAHLLLNAAVSSRTSCLTSKTIMMLNIVNEILFLLCLKHVPKNRTLDDYQDAVVELYNEEFAKKLFLSLQQEIVLKADSPVTQ